MLSHFSEIPKLLLSFPAKFLGNSIVFFLMRWLLVSVALITSGFLSACSSQISAINKTASGFIFGVEDPSVAATLNPNIRYLRVQIEGRTILLALGYIDADPLGPIEVWYSAKGEVLRLQNGHLISMTGTRVEWRSSTLSTMPVWPNETALPITYSRSRDVMPGYRFGVVDQLSLRAVTVPAKSNLVAMTPKTLRWFEESEGRGLLPPARFAVLKVSGQDLAVYGEQCVSAAVCMTWQQWPPAVYGL